MIDVEDPLSLADARGKRQLLIIGAIVVATIVLGAVVAAALIRDAIGDARDALRALPEDTEIIFTADLYQLRDVESYDALMNAFGEILRDQGDIGAQEDPIDALLRNIEEESGLDVREEILPWIGRSLAIGVRGDLTQDVPELVLISLAVRDEAAATAFFREVLPRLDSIFAIEDITVRGRDAFILKTNDDDTTSYLAITDGLAILAISERALTQSLNALDNDVSILDSERFIAAIDRAPRDVWMQAYVDGRLIEDTIADSIALLEDSGIAELDAATRDLMDSLASLESFGAWAKVSNEAITIEAWAIGDDLKAFVGTGSQGIGQDVLESLPGDTFLVAGSRGGEPDAFAQGITSFADIDPGGFGDLRAASIDALGFDVFDELLAGLGNEAFVAILGDDGSVVADQAGISVLVGIGLFDAALVQSGLERVSDFANNEFGADFQESDGIYELVDPSGSGSGAGQPVFAFGVRDGRLYLATSGAAVDELGEHTSSLADSPSLAAISAALDGGDLLLFGDVTTLEELNVMDRGTLPLARGDRLAFGAGITIEEGAVGIRSVLAIVQ